MWSAAKKEIIKRKKEKKIAAVAGSLSLCVCPPVNHYSGVQMTD